MRVPGRRERQRRAWRHVRTAHRIPYEFHGLSISAAVSRLGTPGGFDNAADHPPDGASYQDEEERDKDVPEH